MMSNGLISGVLVVSGSNSMLLKTHVGPDLGHQNCGGQVSHAHQIVGGAGPGKDPVHFAHPAMSDLSHQRDGFQPAETFFAPRPLLLAQGIPRVPYGAAINRAASSPGLVLRHVRRNITRKCRHSATNPDVSKPLSPPTVSGCAPGTFA
jgi:hypothetical protein